MLIPRFLLILTLSAAPAAAQDLRADLLARPITPDLGGATTRPVATREAFTFVAANATDEHRAAFTRGNSLFTVAWTPAPGPDPALDGLGPLFNRDSCFSCHLENGRGAPPLTRREDLETSLVRVSIPGTDPNGGPNPVPIYGDQIQDRGIDGVPLEARPRVRWIDSRGRYADGTRYALRRPVVDLTRPGYGPFPSDVMISLRMSNPVIGVGLLDSVPEATLLALADETDADSDGISGKVNRVFDMASKSMRAGRFGWKANIASLRHQNASAALSDMGLTTAMMPLDLCRAGQSACAEAARKVRPNEGAEISAAQFDDLLLYTQLIAVPRQRNSDAPEVKRGERVFRDFGCAACHLPTLITGEDAALAELRGQVIHPFTDLLLHDMGEGLADGRPDSLATGREWRTPPLWGLGLTEKVNGHVFLLHDGRARGIAEAILWHGGEAEVAKEKFRTASRAVREDLLAFLGSL